MRIALISLLILSACAQRPGERAAPGRAPLQGPGGTELTIGGEASIGVVGTFR